MTTPGGFTETIWHFFGYLRLTEDIARTETLFEDRYRRRSGEDDFEPNTDPPARPVDLEDMTSRAIPFATVTEADAHSLDPMRSGININIPANIPAFALTQPPRLFEQQYLDRESGFAVSGQPRQILVSYQDGGLETRLDIHQVNVMEDRDTVIDSAIRTADGRPYELLPINLDNTFAAMIQSATDAVPAEFRLAESNSSEGIIAAVLARDTAWASEAEAAGGDTPAQTAPTGRIVDGVRSDAAVVEIDDLQVAPWRVSETEKSVETSQSITITGPSDGVATIAEVAQNSLQNAALIRDLNEATGSMIVGGDYFYSRGIVQVNVLTDSDHVTVAACGTGLPSVTTAGNEVHNVAEFVTQDMTDSFGGAASTPRWNVDVFHGDYYDVKMLFQLNDMIDGDCTTQMTCGTYFALHTGLNMQANFAEVTGLDTYDIIIIGGSYHRADWIYQINVVLDCDVVSLLSASNADGGTQVTTGFNGLINNALISTYDSAAFQPLNDSHNALLTSLGNGETVLAPDADWQLAGNATGTLRVLYISGDYYDVNTITQMNLLTDVDQVVQVGTTADTVQGVAAGGNLAQNEAIIVDPGVLSTSKYLGGDAYEESVLIQVNIVTDSDTVVIHDTQALAPELVAFTEETEQPTPECPAPVVCDPAQNDNLMGNIMA